MRVVFKVFKGEPIKPEPDTGQTEEHLKHMVNHASDNKLPPQQQENLPMQESESKSLKVNVVVLAVTFLCCSVFWKDII